ncbi:unnamed protein product [Rhizoctonia solani]|uniref:Prenylcysteine lyase domain-containing protein n=1 Tax=Rhizoctonia solani TaxID=456999 RepID=A0A8H3HXY1_9AGAM|nr:unnamed protein product [Rhizoctonia solani]
MMFLPALILGPSLVTATPFKVAIVGAGAGGSSASYWLSLAKQRAGANVEVTVYEQNNRVGGRSTTVYPYNDASYAPVELGASIFTKGNRNLARAASEFGFDLVSFDSVVPGTGVWNGKEFVYRTTDNATADGIRMQERYQNGPSTSGQLVASFSKGFSTSYTPTFPQFKTVDAYASAVNFTALETVTLKSYLSQQGVNLNWINDFMTGSSRFNYAQDASTINGVAGMTSLAADTAYSAKPGNFKIFEQFLARSGASLELETTVKAITKSKSSKPTYRVETSKGGADFDAVILAAPLPLTNIKLTNTAQPSPFPRVDYVHLHVTLLTTTTPSLLPTYFKTDNSTLPGTVITTAEYSSKPQFNSIRYQATIERGGKTEYVVKMFSMAKVSDRTLATLFGKDSIGWVFRKEWDAYPYYPPRSDYPPVKLDRGLYYVNSMEGLFSTMETETISSRNVVDLLSTELWGSGLCGPKGVKGPVTDSYVIGWDC